MLSVFPFLLNFEMVAPFLLRIGLAVLLFSWSYGNFLKSLEVRMKILGALQFLAGALLTVGLFTQPAAFLSAATVISGWYIKKDNDNLRVYFLAVLVSLSVLLLGPGILAFDFPL